MQLCVPERAANEVWPTLGPQVCDWIEESLVFGPGVLHGQPAKVSDEQRGLIYSFYEIHPQTSPRAGRRRFRRCSVSLRKGLAKTELGAWIVACELHEEAPVRFAGWDADGEPVGIGVADPYIPMLAVTESQSEGLAYAAVRAILLEGPLADDFETGKLFITRKDGRGRCEAVAAAPGVDGGRTTFNLYDEGQNLVLPRHIEAHKTMELNLDKIKDADPWSLEIGTAPIPGEGSVAEGTWEYAEEIAADKRKEAQLFFFARWADENLPLDTREQVKVAVEQASGPAAEWSNIDGITDRYFDPQTDVPLWEARYLNRKVQASRQVFNMNIVRDSIVPLEHRLPPRKTPIAIGFDGSRTTDATGIVGTVIETGYQFVIGVWERPENSDSEWEVPFKAVDEAMETAMDKWKVELVFADPPFWEGLVNTWEGRWPKKVVKYHTNQHKKMALSVQSYVSAVNVKEVTFDGHKDFIRHLGNARKEYLQIPDDDGEKLYIITKERKGSPLKVDLAVAGTLSWQARNTAIGGGALKKAGSKPGRSTVYMGR